MIFVVGVTASLSKVKKFCVVMFYSEVKIWDRRYLNKKSPEPVCTLVHPKGLTSAFFSPTGKYAVTTCNDDRLRVYDVTNMLTTRPNGTFKYLAFWLSYER